MIQFNTPEWFFLIPLLLACIVLGMERRTLYMLGNFKLTYPYPQLLRVTLQGASPN